MPSKQEQKTALSVLKEAAVIPAYQNFLKKEGVNPKKINSFADFQKLPVMDKKSYLYKYDLPEFFINKKVPPMGYASSGSSGRPTFWFRDDQQEKRGGEMHEKVFRDIFGIKQQDPTLVVVCYSMGLWVAGNYTAAACREIARKGYALSVITPGAEKEDILNALKNLAPKFKNVIVVGYPPFLMDIFNDARSRKISLTKFNLKILTAGDKFSENWRSSLLKLVKLKNPFNSLVSMYGCADAMVLGHETPLSIFIRREANKNPKLFKDFFGRTDSLPGLVQYYPEHIYFEEINGELIFTTKVGTPLVRYNIHDSGKVLRYEEVCQVLKTNKLLGKARACGLMNWQLPFVALKGRTDVAVTFYALNIYPENILAGLEDKKIKRFLSGNFLAYNKSVNENKNQKLFIRLELASDARKNKKLDKLAREAMVKNLITYNMEYRKLYSILGERAAPVVELVESGHKDFLRKDSAAAILAIKGKKPKVILS